MQMTKDKFEQGVKLLRKLVDLQNGPPLYQDTKEWEETMTSVYKFLEENETQIPQV